MKLITAIIQPHKLDDVKEALAAAGWDEWIRICKSHGLTRSMSAKGCSPDNAAAEGFFGRLKQEFFHKRSFQGVSIDEFITLLDEYMVWYRDKRIKLEYGMSIMDKRIQLGLVA